MVRTCPACGHENASEGLFCSDCGADIRQIALQPASSAKPGIDVMRNRVLRDQRRERRLLERDNQGGGGWILISPFLLLPMIALPTDSILRYGVWLIGMAFALYGIWRIRHDSAAIRGWGVFFGIVTVITFGYLGLQVWDNRAPASSGLQDDLAVAAMASPEVGVLPSPASPSDGSITTNVVSFRGDNAHTGQQPGPIPSGNPVLAWRFDTGGSIYSTPVIADGVIYTANKSGWLFAIDALTGQERWRYQLTDYVIRSSPAIANGIVYIGAGFNLFALDAVTGTLRWQTPTRYAGQSTPTISDGIVVMASQEEWIDAFDAKTGEARWRIPSDGVVFGSPAIAEGTVVFGTDKGMVTAVKLDDGHLLWRRSITGGVIAGPTMSDTQVFVTTETGTTVAMGITDGVQRWQAEVGGNEPPAIVSSFLVVSSIDGGVHAIDQQTGSDLWLYPTGKQRIAAPVTVDGSVIVGADNTLLILDGTDGTLKSYYLANGEISTSAVVSDGYMFFGGIDGFLYALTSNTPT